MKKDISPPCYASQFQGSNESSYRSVIPCKEDIAAYQNLKADYYNQVLEDLNDDFDLVLKALDSYHALNKHQINENVSAYFLLDAQLLAYEQLDYPSLNLQEQSIIMAELSEIKTQMLHCLSENEDLFQKYDINVSDEIQTLMHRLNEIVNPVDDHEPPSLGSP